MTQDEIIRMAREAGFDVDEGLFPFEASEDKYIGTEIVLERFAALVAAHEREKWEPAFSKNKPAPKIENGSVRFEAGLYTPLEVQLAIDLLAEREECAKVVESGVLGHEECAAAIRARGK